jgi:hypothetical protein
MSLLSEEQMSGISPQRKNRNKCKNKTRNDNSDQIPAHVRIWITIYLYFI